MVATLLIAAVLGAGAPHLPVHHVAQSSVGGHQAPQKVDDVNLVAYCDTRGQSTILVKNGAPTPLVVEWTLTAFMPGYPPDSWSSVSRVDPGQFEEWMSPAPYLHLDIRYDDDGLPATDSIDTFCMAAASLVSGLEE
ncbi:MAG: hypothetical protein ACHQM4_10355 [Thermoanaerobaculia bacterium]